MYLLEIKTKNKRNKGKGQQYVPDKIKNKPNDDAASKAIGLANEHISSGGLDVRDVNMPDQSLNAAINVQVGK